MIPLILCDTCVVIDFINKNSDALDKLKSNILFLVPRRSALNNLLLATRSVAKVIPKRSLGTRMNGSVGAIPCGCP